MFTSLTNGLDLITNFLSGTDVLRISTKGLGGGLSAGCAPTLMTAGDFAAANNPGGGVIYDNAGANAATVYFGAGGSTADAVAITRFSLSRGISTSDIQIVA